MKGMWSVACLDLMLWTRMPIAVASALIPPLTMTLLLIVLSLAVTQQPVALVVETYGTNADKMAKIIQDDADAYLLTVTDAKSAKQLLYNQEVAAVITIPQDFEKRMDEGYPGTVVLTLNNVDIDFADDIRRSVDRSVASFDAPQLNLAEKEGNQGASGSPGAFAAETSQALPMRLSDQPNPYLINIEERDLRETNVQWLNYQVIPALVLLVLSVGLMGTALLCAQDIERKTARYLLVTPQMSWVLVAGRLLGGFLSGMIVLVPAIGICVLTKVIDPPMEHWPALAAVFAATALSAAGFGAILGSVLSGARTIALASSVIATYLFLLGGGFTNIAFLPQWLRTLSSLVPTRYAIDGMRQALFYQNLDGVATDITVLCVTALIACAVGSFNVRRSWIG
jgi:ABC-2 type transport system permease protein